MSEILEVTRNNYLQYQGAVSDVVIDAASNSKKFWAEENPFEEFDASVGHRLRTLRDFPASLHLHISSVDVYDDLSSPTTTHEKTPIHIGRTSFYGLHKLIAEQLVMKHAKRWLILRLAGMVGPGLRKNPVYDILHGQPLRIHPDSEYQFMSTDAVAETALKLLTSGISNEVFNLCGDGLITPRKIAGLAQRSMNLSQLPSQSVPRIVNISLEKMKAHYSLPNTESTVTHFLSTQNAANPELRNDES